MSKSSLVQYCPPVEDQRRYFQRSCGGYAAAYALSIMHLMDRKARKDFSPFFSWNAAKWLDGVTGDSDTFPIGVAKGVHQFGGLPLEFANMRWKQNADVDPNGWEIATAAQFKPDAIYSMNPRTDMEHGEQVLEQMKIFLRVRPVIAAIKVYQTLMVLRDEIWMPPEDPSTTQPLYGHIGCFVGFDDNEESLLHIGSWGTAWGKNGYGRIHYNAVRTLTVSGAWSWGRLNP